jgi:hypothetical protein
MLFGKNFQGIFDLTIRLSLFIGKIGFTPFAITTITIIGTSARTTPIK